MDPRRRGILAALLCSPAALRAIHIEQTTTVELPKDFTLRVVCDGKTVTLSADTIMRALEQPQFRPNPDAPGDFH